MKNFKIIISIILALFLSGCSNYQNLKDLDVVEGVAVDFSQEEFEVSIQGLNITKGGSVAESLSGNITNLTSGKGLTISAAVADCSKEKSKRMFFGHNAIIVLGKGFIENGIEKSLDYMLRSVDSRPDVIVAISENEAKDIMECTQEGSLVPAENITCLIENGERSGISSFTTVKDLMNNYAFDTSDISLTMLSSKKDGEEKNCEIKGIAVFSKNEYKTTLSKEESMGFLFLNNKIKNGKFTINSENLGDIGAEIKKSKSKTVVSSKGEIPTVKINIKTTIAIDEIEKGFTTQLSEKDYNSITSLCENKIKGYCDGAITTSFANGSDVFNIGRRLSGSNKKLYEKLKKDWRQNLQFVETEVIVECSVEKINDNTVNQ